MGDQTDFNMSLATLIRIDTLLTSSNSFKVSNDIYKWFLVLLGLYSELSVFINPDDLPLFENKIIEFSKIFSKIHNDIADDKPYFVDLDTYMLLLHFEISLRNVAKDNGLLIKFKEIEDIDTF